MKETVSDIVSKAHQFGACEKLDGINDWKSLSRILFTAQGREFCEKYKYPSLDQWKQMDCDLEGLNIHVDKGNITLSDNAHIAVIGNTSAEINVTSNEYVTKIIVMHGAKAVINAHGYPVILIVNIGGEVKVNKDSTSVIL